MNVTFYFICFFGIVAIAAFTFIIWTLRTMWTEIESYLYFSSPPIIERVYRAHDLKTYLRYMEREAMDKYPHSIDFAEKVVMDAEHKQHLIRQQAQKLTDEMLAQGLIEIDDEIDYCRSPYHKVATLRVKVYKFGGEKETRL